MSLKFTTEEFVEKAVAVHGTLFDYSKVQYRGATSKVIVGCRIHGDFLISPDAHANGGQGCAKCKFDKIGNLRRGTVDAFLNRAIEVHGKRYDYSTIGEYKHNKHKLQVRCKLHGPFMVSPNNHLKGRGCPGCKTSGYRSNLPGHLYILTAGSTTKVGITNRQPATRAREVSKSSGKQFSVVHSIFLEDGLTIAKLEHHALSFLRDNYETVAEEYKGSTESFIDVDVGILIKKIAERVIAL